MAQTDTPPQQAMKTRDLLKISVLALALAATAGGLGAIILPVRLLDFVPAESKNTYLGFLSFAGLAVAMLTQPLTGAISDRTTSRWGKRRPYIFTGIIAAALLLLSIALVQSYAALFAVILLLQVASNTAQSPYQAIIPDLVPRKLVGAAAGVKTMAEILGTVVFLAALALLMDAYQKSQSAVWLWSSLGLLALVLISSMLITVFSLKQHQWQSSGARPAGWTHAFAAEHEKVSDFGWFLASRFLFYMVIGAALTFGYYTMKDYFGLERPAQGGAQVIGIAGGLVLVLAYPMGRLSDRVGRKPVLIPAALLGASGFVLVGFNNTYAALTIGGVMIAIAIAAFQSVNWALAADLVPQSRPAYFLGLTNIATAGGSGLVRLSGPLIDFLNRHQTGLGYRAVIFACAAFLLGSGLLLLKVHEHPAKRSAKERSR